ncbi:Methyl-accepting chemotaxis protein I [Paraburkholderia ultramafica]|uniref:Methyl-accepting chemotaxis protein I n=1 Tax=Paraburkholderia ultramafica TaxID=1544867 RepID=A0A6S7DJ30_9BURK|nr:methyl-accepting chemotaxis protein [Paraburkholderia ultramafica]CAB3810089.1 Methyl-accepting chemotaxis protein I [Paraburkholderia ultramafica]
MLKNLSIRVRLALAMGFLSVLLIIGGVIGIVGVSMSNSDIQELYSSRLASAEALGQASVSVARTRIWLFRIALDPTSPDVPQWMQNARDLLTATKKAWDAYRALPFSGPDEERRAADVNARLEKLISDGMEPMFSAIAAHDVAKLAEVTLHQPPSLFIAVTDGMDALDRIQVTAAQATFEAAQARFHGFVGVAIAGILVALGAAALAWWSLQRAIGAPLAQALVHFRAIADGDLTTRVEVRTRDEMGQLMSGLQAMQGKLVQTISVVREGSRSIDTAAQEISAGNLDLSQRTEEQAASLEETASSMEELTSTVRQNADNAKQATTLATTASGVAQRGGEVIGHVVETMHGISDSSAKVAEIISVIEGIAFQTNILALNAAVEAARAGEQGRGFAVVAGEVRTLAQRSATAAKEIKDLIGESVTRVDAGSKLVEEAGSTINEIVQSVQRVTDIMSEIAAASEEQSTGIGQVNTAVTQMDEVTQQNAALVEQASAAAQSMAEQAKALRDAVAVFKVDDRGASASRVMAPRSEPRRPAPKARTSRPATLTRPETAPLVTPGTTTLVATGSSADDWQAF